ncbi:MAG: hypothetical protein WCE53_04680 [Candidatus Acidiferrum sp.]
MTTKKRINHFVFLNPGERLFVCTDRVAGEDYTQVVEVVFPTYQDEGGGLAEKVYGSET